MSRLLSLVAVFLLAGSALADEFFETKIRPVLVESCYSCHSAKAKKLKGNLKVDSREALLKVGASGKPSVVPGSPEKSLLIEAISYKDVDLQMPPKGKLPAAVIADFEKWIKDGAAWPVEKKVGEHKNYELDIEKRKQEHWSWAKIKPLPAPAVKSPSSTVVDRFLNAKLEEKGLTPAPAADARVILRRLSFDIIGLPPSPQMLAEFEKAFAVDRKKAVDGALDHLLASPQFGERWGRHWLDLMRYGESRGHEFDFTLPDAYQYRDYVIRALNADVPYDLFVREHLAGDLLPQPRLNAKEGFNESILGTGFWYLGEQVHSPVDICQDRAERLDNQLDVMSKAFLGLTVSCARCHDHKFDAISAKDYYALAGFLESSSYRLVPFDSLEHNRKVAGELWKLRAEYRSRMAKEIAATYEPALKSLPDYLEEARATIQKGMSTLTPERRAELDPKRVALWADHLRMAVKNQHDPLHAFACEALSLPVPSPKNAPEAAKKTQAVLDFRSCSPECWLPDGFAFGPGPVQPGMVRPGSSASIATEAAAEYDPLWSGLKTKSENESSLRGMRSGKTIRTPKFDIETGVIHVRMRGSATVYAAVEGHVVIQGPLHGSLVRSLGAGPEYKWVAIDLGPYKGRRVHLEFTPESADFGLAKVTQGPLAADDPLACVTEMATWDGVQKPVAPPQHAARLRSHFEVAIKSLNTPEEATPLSAHRVNWLLSHPALLGVETPLAATLKNFADEQAKVAAQIRLDSRLAPAILDGNGVNERVFLRGSYKTLGEVAPRRYLEALAGAKQIQTDHGSGRLELAKQITDPSFNPFFTRVFVNRVWHHMFGRGLVGSVDNFGVLGEPPTHPELLDQIADQFAKDGYSLKTLIRKLAETDAYQRSSMPSAEAAKIDPANLLLQHARVRRLEGEAIRDALLSISGRLDPTQFGPSIPVHLTDFQHGRGRPASGPIDGAGRRSIYLAVRRNFLSPMLLAFDTPIPFSTVGRRSVSNVPAQALILLNDPFVHQQAEVWAKKVLAEPGSEEQRLTHMYLAAYGRAPTAAELAACRKYLGATPDAATWASLAHVLINGKEFIFLE